MAGRKGSSCVCEQGHGTQTKEKGLSLSLWHSSLDRASSFGLCNAGNTWENWREVLEGSRAVGAGVLGI